MLLACLLGSDLQQHTSKRVHLTDFLRASCSGRLCPLATARASTLVALGVKMGRPPRREAGAAPSSAIVLEEVPSKAEGELKPMLPSPRSVKRRSPDDEAEKFGVAMIRPAEQTRLSPSDIRGAYIDWCAEIGMEPLPMKEIAPALGKLFRSAGIEIQNGYAWGVKIKS